MQNGNTVWCIKRQTWDHSSCLRFTMALLNDPGQAAPYAYAPPLTLFALLSLMPRFLKKGQFSAVCLYSALHKGNLILIRPSRSRAGKIWLNRSF